MSSTTKKTRLKRAEALRRELAREKRQRAGIMLEGSTRGLITGLISMIILVNSYQIVVGLARLDVEFAKVVPIFLALGILLPLVYPTISLISMLRKERKLNREIAALEAPI